jgi:hypothetical protein
MTPFSQRWGFWSRVALKDGGDDGGNGGDDSNNPSNYFDDRDGDGVANIFDFDDGVGWADTSAPDTGGGSDDNDDGPTFGEAFAAARAAQGAGGTFTWNGQQYSTETAEDVAARNAAAAAAQAEANQQAALASQMEQERRNRLAQEAAAVAEAAAQAEANQQAALASQMEQERRNRLAQEAAAVAEAAAQAEANRQALLESQMAEERRNRDAQEAKAIAEENARIEANRQAALASQMEQERRNRLAQEAAAAEAERQRQAELAAQMEAEAEAADIDRLPDVVGPGQTAEDYFAQNPQELIDFQEQQDQAYQDMLARAEARDRERLAAQMESEAETAGLTRPGQTMPGDTFQDLYGYDPLLEFTPERIATATAEELADLALATGRTDLISQLLEGAPGAVLAPGTPGSAVITEEFPAGTVGTEVQESYQPSELETILEASPEARTLYRDLGITSRLRVSTPNDPTSGTRSYYDAAGNPLTEAQVRDLIAGAETVTVPGGTSIVRPVDIVDPGVTGTSPGLTPVNIEEARARLEANIITLEEFERMFPGVLETLPPIDVPSPGMTPATPLDTSGGIDSLLPPAPPAGGGGGGTPGMTTGAPLDTSGGIDSLMPPPPVTLRDDTFVESVTDIQDVLPPPPVVEEDFVEVELPPAPVVEAPTPTIPTETAEELTIETDVAPRFSLSCPLPPVRTQL